MKSIICNICHDGGYLDYDTYCDCPIGIFYEEHDKLNLQNIYNEVDVEYESDYYGLNDHRYFEDRIQYTTLYLLSVMPFYDGALSNDYDDYYI